MHSSKLKNKPKLKTLPTELSMETIAFEAIGTSWCLNIPQELAKNKKIKMLESISARIEVFDKNYSRFRSDSLVSRMSRKAGVYQIPLDALPMLELYKRLYNISGGLVTPLVGQLLSDSGYDKDYSFTAKELKHPLSWEDALIINKNTVELYQPSLLDFGAIGKGYLVDIIAEIISEDGVHDFSIDAGGDIIARQTTSRPLAVGLEHPAHDDEAVGISHLINQSICGSASNRRSWGKYNHIMNPRTLTPAEGLTAVWATGSSTMLADAMTTALYFVEPTVLLKHFDFEYALIRPDLSLEVSNNFPAKFFSEYEVGSMHE
jgi:thiamine biosynthesis lipoprotein